MHFKIPANLFCLHRKGLKLLVLMKLTAIVILATALHVCANGHSQTITLSKKNARLTKVFIEIRKQTGYNFLYNDDWLRQSRPVTIMVNNAPLKDVLDICFHDQPFTYSIVEKTIVIKEVVATDIPSLPPITVKGKITDNDGNPMTGVSVSVKGGQSAGVVTDDNGNFSIEVEDNAILEISYVGFQTQTIRVTPNRTTLSLSLQKAANDLGEVVVVGYGRDTKKKLVTSVSTIKTDNIVTLPYTNLADALAGRAPGVITLNQGGEPGSVARVSIRGGSGPDRAEPLYVIDNVVSSKFDFQNLQPQDIENISVLKDGGATAVYGSRASNGIILVTTRQGKKGKTAINFNALYELSSPTVLPQRISGYDYALSQNLAAIADKRTDLPFRQTLLDTIRNQSDPYNWANTDWYDIALRKRTPQMKYGVDMSGGSDKTKYFMSLSYYDQGSNYRTDVTGFKRYTGRANITQSFDKQGITVGLNMYGTFTNNRFPSASAFAIWSHLQNSSPLKNPYNPNGTYSAGVDHALVDIDSRSGYFRDEFRNMNGNLNIEWAVPWVKGLKATVLGYYKTEDRFRKGWNTRTPQFDNLGIEQQRSLPTLGQTADRYQNYTLQGRIDYQRTFGVHTISALALYEETEEKSEFTSANRVDFLSSAIDQLFAGSNQNIQNGGGAGEGGRRGYVGRLKYDYASRYIVEGSFRQDGSDRFPKGKKYGFFPSLALGWIISEENFFHSFKNVVNELKLRYTIAATGNDAVTDPAGNPIRFPYLLNSYSLNQNTYVIGGSPVTGFSEGILVDPFSTTWYTTKDYNTGIDFSLFKNKVYGRFDYFYKRTTGYIIPPAARYTTPLGTSLPYVKSNTAFRRAGYEFELNYTETRRDFTYNVGGNITLYNQLYERNDQEDSVTLKNPLTRTTHETDFWGRGYINDGYYGDVNEIINRPRRIAANQLVPGDLSYADINGDGKLDGSDQIRMGNSAFPRLMYGINLSGTYKTISLEMLWQGSGSRSRYLNGTLQARYAGAMVYDYQKDFWTPDNKNARYPRQTLVDGANSNNNYSTSDFWLYDARYLRLKSMRLAWNVKKQFPGALSFANSCFLSLNGTNILTFSKVKKYFDPETSDESNYGYPVQKVYSIGLNIGF